MVYTLSSKLACDCRQCRLENPCKIRQRFVDASVLMSALNWSKRLSKFKKAVQVSFELCNVVNEDFPHIFNCKFGPVYPASVRGLTFGQST